MMKTKIIFFGSSDFMASTAHILEALNKNFEIILVVTQDDKIAGREKSLRQTAVAESAQKLGLKVIKPETLKDPEVVLRIAKERPDIFVVVSYGKIIPQNLLDIPKFGALNIHPSLLPKYRGVAPIPAALLNGDKDTGVSIMLMDSQMDHGPILKQEIVAISDNETAVELNTKLVDLSAHLITEIIPKFVGGELKSTEQNQELASFTKIITKQDGQVDWHKSAGEIYNQYRAFTVWPGIWTSWQGKILKINKCAILKPENAQKNSTDLVGKVAAENRKIWIFCGQGALELLEVQLEGKKSIPVAEFINGRNDFVGSLLGLG